MIQQDESYTSVLRAVLTWSPHERYLLIQDLLKTLEPEVESTKKEDTLRLAHGLLATEKHAPSDEDVAQWLEEHRLGKYG